jgi:hypothetical protein
MAETGTLILESGTDNPTTINFLPEVHMVVVRAGDIVGDYETAWTALRQRHGKGEMPRTVNMVTGPSRSADIEQTLLLGAHGPRRLHVMIVGSDCACALLLQMPADLRGLSTDPAKDALCPCRTAWTQPECRMRWKRAALPGQSRRAAA